MPLDGVNITPDNSLLADQSRAAVEPGASARAVVQVQPPLPMPQSEFAAKLLELLVKVGGAIQFHSKWSILLVSSSVKRRSTLAGQFILERVILTCSVSPGARLPLDGLKSTPRTLLDADHSRLVSLFESLLSVTLQFQTCSWLPVQAVFALILLPGLIVKPDDFLQLHGTETVLFDPSKLKEPLRQSLFGTKMFTCAGRPGDMVPLVWVKFTPCNLLLADQSMLL